MGQRSIKVLWFERDPGGTTTYLAPEDRNVAPAEVVCAPLGPRVAAVDHDATSLRE